MYTIILVDGFGNISQFPLIYPAFRRFQTLKNINHNLTSKFTTVQALTKLILC
jgi:hypothetical protein